MHLRKVFLLEKGTVFSGEDHWPGVRSELWAPEGPTSQVEARDPDLAKS